MVKCSEMAITPYNYKCLNCNETFDEPDSRQEYMGEFWGMPAYDTIYICPHCGSDEIVDTGEEMWYDDKEARKTNNIYNRTFDSNNIYLDCIYIRAYVISMVI